MLLLLLVADLGACAAPATETAAPTACPTPEGDVVKICAPGLDIEEAEPTGGDHSPESVVSAPTLAPGPAGPAAPTLESTPATSSPTPTNSAPKVEIPDWSPCSEDVCIRKNVFLFERPIVPPGREAIDSTYRFGTTVNGQRDPHHGVEMLNSSGTPVHAAAAGRVVVAGDDSVTAYANYTNIYGNLVVIEHDFPSLDAPVYTLYGHLAEVLVQPGQQVHPGDTIGKVGMTGAATGSHLHFEVRWDENEYTASRNPELWLQPPHEDDLKLGAIAGRILDQDGSYLPVENIVVERFAGPQGPAEWETYLRTYEEKDLVGQPPWEENFALGDLPPGWYRISFVQYGMQSRVVEVVPGSLTLLTFHLSPNGEAAGG